MLAFECFGLVNVLEKAICMQYLQVFQMAFEEDEQQPNHKTRLVLSLKTVFDSVLVHSLLKAEQRPLADEAAQAADFSKGEVQRLLLRLLRHGDSDV